MNESIIQTDADHPTISRLLELQKDATDKEFAKQWLSVSETTWYRVRLGKYKAANHASVLRKLTNDLAELEDHLALTSGRRSEILPLSHISQARSALHLAFLEDRNRLIIILADTGGGKTAIARGIARDFQGRVVNAEASETWRKSYLAGLHGIGLAAGLQDMSRNNTRAAETELIAELTIRPRIIVIDEGNYFGPACLNLIKLILNRTASIVLLLGLPTLWQYITKASQVESRQLRNRTAALLQFDEVKLADVRLALETTVPSWPSLGKDRDIALKKIREAANRFGLWNTVFSIAAFIAEETQDMPVTLPIVERAISDIQNIRK